MVKPFRLDNQKLCFFQIKRISRGTSIKMVCARTLGYHLPLFINEFEEKVNMIDMNVYLISRDLGDKLQI